MAVQVSDDNWIISNLQTNFNLGGRHSSALAFALPTQPRLAGPGSILDQGVSKIFLMTL